MDVVIANKYKNELSNLDIDIIKSISGEYEVSEIGEMFRNFFFDRMIIDVTAFRGYDDYNIYKKLVSYLDPDKLIFLLPEGSSLCTPNFLGQLISYGIYNFTTNLNGVGHLLKRPNTAKDVEHIAKLAHVVPKDDSGKKNAREETGSSVSYSASKSTNDPVPRKKTAIIGIRNVTSSAGATTLTYMMKRELALALGQESVLAIEVDKNDFAYFYDKRMISVKQDELEDTLKKYSSLEVILIDLNGYKDDSFCKDVLYLIEPSTLKLNRLVRRNKTIFQNLSGKKVILNQSALQNNDIFDFESEAGIKVYYNIPSLDERKRNSVISGFLSRLGLTNANNSGTDSSKIFGLFRR